LKARLATIVGIAAIFIATLTAFAGTPAAHAATSSPVAATSRSAPARPATVQSVTLKIRCGKFAGTIDHHGIGGILDPAYLIVKGKLSSSCNSTTFLEVKYQNGFKSYGPTQIGKAGARKTATINWDTTSRDGQYAHIAVRIGTTDGMPKGKIYWGPWKNV
jgi:hypothetical protein